MGRNRFKRPYDIYNGMKMVGHNHKFVHLNGWKKNADLQPLFLDHLTGDI